MDGRIGFDEILIARNCGVSHSLGEDCIALSEDSQSCILQVFLEKLNENSSEF